MSEELAMLRKEEMMSRMEAVLRESEGFDKLIARYMHDKDTTIKTTQQQ